jgi:DNA-binding SARP family transcriptional activator/DNA-binding XRE family transcriptional regulator
MTRHTVGPGELSIGSLIKQQRTARNLTQYQLAQSAGVSIGTLRDVEQGRTLSPRWELLRNISAVLGFDEAQLMNAAPRDSSRPAPVAAEPHLRSPVARGACVYVLGPMMFQRDGARISLGSIRQRGVLGLLAAERGSDVPQAALVDALWGERAPKSARAMVQRYVWQLRKLLGADDVAAASSGLSITGKTSYRLEATCDQLDLLAFEQLARSASAHDEGDPLSACELYERALALWRGEVLADIDLLHHHPVVVELRAAYADTVLRYAELATRLGRPSQALPYLRRLCSRDRFNEHAHARLMTALAAIGQQAAALRVYSDLRCLLRSELGMDPSPLMAAAQASVLRQGTDT